MLPSLADPMRCTSIEEKVLIVTDWVTVKSGVCVCVGAIFSVAFKHQFISNLQPWSKSKSHGSTAALLIASGHLNDFT